MIAVIRGRTWTSALQRTVSHQNLLLSSSLFLCFNKNAIKDSELDTLFSVILLADKIVSNVGCVW